MNINISNFKDILRKATMNYSINSVQLIFSEGRIRSKMISDNRDCIVLLDVENNVIPELIDGDFNFSEPSQQLKPFLNLIEEGDDIDSNIEIFQEKVIITQGDLNVSVFFCDPIIVSTFGSDSAKKKDSFLSMTINDEFMNIFSKIGKIGSRFGKVYFNVKDGKFSIETSDKTNVYSNGLEFDLNTEKDMSKDIGDITLCFNYKNMVNLMSIVKEGDTLNFSYIKDQEMGMLSAVSSNGNEKYYLMSREM